MTENAPTQEEPHAAKTNHEELEQFLGVINKCGRPIMYGLLAALVIAAGWRVYRSNKLKIDTEAQIEFSTARTTADLQLWTERYPKAMTAPLAGLKLAAAHYSDGQYSQSLDVYEAWIEANPKHIFTPVAKLGRAQSLEASGQTDAALKAFHAFQNDYGDHFLQPEAVLGQARCLAQQKQYEKARIACEDLIAARPKSEWSMRAEQTIRFIERREHGGAMAGNAEEMLGWDMTAPSSTDTVPNVPTSSVAPTPIEKTEAVVETTDTNTAAQN